MNRRLVVMALQLQLLIFFLAASFVTCFLSNTIQQKKAASPSSTSTRLFGINEWRDLDFNLPGRSRDTLGNDEAPPRSICILPFPYQEVLLQGETKQLRLYEERFIKLFQHVQEHHAGVVGMGLMADSGIIQTMPICEVEASNTMDGFGIFVTIRVVGRASLLEITQQEPYLRGACIEVADVLPPNLELPNLLANNIENHMLLLSSMEQRFKETKLRNNSSGNNTGSSAIVQDEEMAARIALAKLVSVLCILFLLVRGSCVAGCCCRSFAFAFSCKVGLSQLH
jgi:Lon protease-like protein